MVENLISEGIGVIVELFLVYLVISVLLDKREKKRWEPVNKLVITKILSISHGIQAALQTVSIGKPDSPQLVAHMLGRVKYDLNKLQLLVDLNGAGLGSKMLPIVMELIELYEKLIAKNEFLINIHDPNRINHDFVIYSPISELERVEEILDILKAEYPALFEDLRPEGLDVTSLSQLWETFVENKNVFDKPESFKANQNRKVYAFNVDTMKLVNLSVRTQVEVYTTYM